jgi:hypothetical protein
MIMGRIAVPPGQTRRTGTPGAGVDSETAAEADR